MYSPKMIFKFTVQILLIHILRYSIKKRRLKTFEKKKRQKFIWIKKINVMRILMLQSIDLSEFNILKEQNIFGKSFKDCGQSKILFFFVWKLLFELIFLSAFTSFLMSNEVSSPTKIFFFNTLHQIIIFWRICTCNKNRGNLNLFHRMILK